jgi:hypothetical protein
MQRPAFDAIGRNSIIELKETKEVAPEKSSHEKTCATDHRAETLANWNSLNGRPGRKCGCSGWYLGDIHAEDPTGDESCGCIFHRHVQRRTGWIYCLHLRDPSQIPAVAEPFFLAFNARVWFSPV